MQEDTFVGTEDREGTDKTRILLDTMASLVGQHERLEFTANRTTLTVSAGLAGLPAALASQSADNNDVSATVVVGILACLVVLSVITVLFLMTIRKRVDWLKRAIVNVQVTLGFYHEGYYRSEDFVKRLHDSLGKDSHLGNEKPKRKQPPKETPESATAAVEPPLLEGVRLFDKKGLQWGADNWLQTNWYYISAIIGACLTGAGITLTLL